MNSELAKKLLNVPQRENAGARSSNRFTYQHVWAFDYLLKVMNSNKDFILFMEFHDDIIVIERANNNEFVEFYQIKTDDKDSRFITASFITKNSNKYPDKMSIAQKMIDNFVKFGSQTKAIHLVSNKCFELGILMDSTESKTRNTVILNELNKSELVKIKKGMCQACNKRSQCQEDCLNLIYFDVSDLDLVSYEDTVMGRLVSKLESLGIPSTIERTRSVYNTILGEIRRINNSEKSSQNVAELLQNKSISKHQFLEWINKLRIDMPDDLWNQIQLMLLKDGFTVLEIRKIHKQWRKFQIESMNVEALGLHRLSMKAYELIEKNEDMFVCSKDLIEHVYNFILQEKESRLYNKEYLYAIIIKEMFA